MSRRARLAAGAVLVLLLPAAALTRLDRADLRPLLHHTVTTLERIAEAVSASAPGTRACTPPPARRAPPAESADRDRSEPLVPPSGGLPWPGVGPGGTVRS
ncbi:hypothetical protein [Streptomyces sp. NRRL F-4428]|uniref:hypothetical protein n=1 Tax=Streptomyces sp. NRRL F-4428 TaxID=1609137 RepID=UPI0005EC8DB0|nr:hypothetical protein [Streptomyces sp. NRRL F-4428]KJK45331.1 hypothetical protein UK14_26310 [Streptomyces sp. NRRL F-4428]